MHIKRKGKKESKGKYFDIEKSLCEKFESLCRVNEYYEVAFLENALEDALKRHS